MSKEAIIERTVEAINGLPSDKAEEILDFANFLSKRYDERRLQAGIQQAAADGRAFDFLNSEEDLYSVADLKEVYNG